MNTYKKGIAPIIIVLVLAALAGGATYYVKQRGKSAQAPGQETAAERQEDAAQKRVQIPIIMRAQSNTDQSGRVLLTDVNGKTKVTFSIGSGPEGVAQPAHIHIGSCPTPGAVKYPLNNVVNGRSETMLDVSLLQLANELPLAINVHRSATQISTYVSCGDLPMQSFEALDANAMMKDDGAMMQKGTTHVVRMSASGFSPASITIKKGDTVQFMNNDARDWWPASAMHPTHEVYGGTSLSEHCPSMNNSAFDACQGIKSGASWLFTFEKVGTWGYHDHLRATMRGTIVVQ